MNFIDQLQYYLKFFKPSQCSFLFLSTSLAISHHNSLLWIVGQNCERMIESLINTSRIYVNYLKIIWVLTLEVEMNKLGLSHWVQPISYDYVILWAVIRRVLFWVFVSLLAILLQFEKLFLSRQIDMDG